MFSKSLDHSTCLRLQLLRASCKPALATGVAVPWIECCLQECILDSVQIRVGSANRGLCLPSYLRVLLVLWASAVGAVYSLSFRNVRLAYQSGLSKANTGEIYSSRRNISGKSPLIIELNLPFGGSPASNTTVIGKTAGYVSNITQLHVL